MWPGLFQFVWPHVQPQAEELLRRFHEHRLRQREQAYSSIPNDKDDDDHGDYSDSHFKQAEARGVSSPSLRGQDSDFLLNAGGLRQRSHPAANSIISNEKLLDFDVEMVNMVSTLSRRPAHRAWGWIPPISPLSALEESGF